MKIVVVGGGNVGTQFAVHCASKGHEVTIYTSRPQDFSSELFIVGEGSQIIMRGSITCATDDPSIAFGEAELVLVTLPAYCMQSISEIIYPYSREGMIIGLVPGTGGGECAFYKCIDKGAVVFGMQRVPSVARLLEYGKSVCAMGYRSRLHIGAIPAASVSVCAGIVSQIFDIECVELPNYLNVSLTPSNPVLHTTRLSVIFKDYYEGFSYENIPLFYEEWDDESSLLLLESDREVQGLCARLSEFDLSYVGSLADHYESKTPEQLTKKIRSIDSLKGLRTPAVVSGNGLVPDFSSRYFAADFPYGLCILLQIADFAGHEMPHLRETMEWYRRIVSSCREFNYAEYGISNRSDFLSLYRQ